MPVMEAVPSKMKEVPLLNVMVRLSLVVVVVFERPYVHSGAGGEEPEEDQATWRVRSVIKAKRARNAVAHF